MKSNKQRRQEIKAQRLRRIVKKTRAVNARPVDRPIGTVAVTPLLLRHNNSYGIPDFVQRGYYQDRPFRCKDCGVEEIWTAAQQQWWYEEAQGDVWTVAVRCRICRQHERERKAEARRVHREGLAMKQGRLSNHTDDQRHATSDQNQ
ncbi:MAG: zinc-ribbon domain containing protein [Candidatus Competibacteraceae bacterium]|uniref:Probable zinc-binding domain-containing protein n=1 Tax=Candidatus Contendobacter odensis Run_B_J11 TaxID=1400861 RepID=A0A7U7GE58_9GAMM|nr:zinc-ribbon domain containing protein [Candidatus Contendobacter odensis]MBK8535347.1 zinc-ribbon domain containing protein [Candidatus Competibacteraceae bacterium]CDH46469.1 conserved hypothetical protein [Candidatus Contendobacter odensis Run_B_J11]